MSQATVTVACVVIGALLIVLACMRACTDVRIDNMSSISLCETVCRPNGIKRYKPTWVGAVECECHEPKGKP